MTALVHNLRRSGACEKFARLINHRQQMNVSALPLDFFPKESTGEIMVAERST